MLTPTEVENLGTMGFFVRDAFFGGALAQRVRVEASAVTLQRAGIGRSHQRDEDVRTDRIAWVAQDNAAGNLAVALEHFSRLMGELNEAAWLGLRSFDLQLACYAPGARYARHRDAFQGQDTRRVTAIVYLNPHWQPADGGQLRLYSGTTAVDIAPVLDRLVIFRSEVVEHEVLPTQAERWALTAWYCSRS